MKKWFSGLMALTVLFCFPQESRADALSDVLNLYGTSTEVVDLEQYKRDLSVAKEIYFDLKNKYSRDEFFKKAADVANAMEIESPNLAAKVDRDRKYLISLVNIEADLKLIFEAENEYRASMKEYSEYLHGRSEFLLDTYNLSGVTKEQVNEAVDTVNEIQTKMGTLSLRPDIGVLTDLQSPTRGVWRLTSGFGYRTNPMTGKGQQFHNGIDLGAPEGTDILSLFGGKVIYAGNKGDGYGNCVLVSHSNEFQTFYAHMSSLSVSTGDAVVQYQKIGEAGSTGMSTGSHLHLSAFVNGQKVDPLRLFGGRS